MFGRKGVETYFCVPLNERPVRLSVRTAPFHGAKTGSIPVPATEQTRTGKGFQRIDTKSVAKSVANKAQILPQPVKDLATFSHYLQDEFLQSKNSMQLHLPFKPAKLYAAGGDITKRWYIEFYYLYPGSPDTYKRFKEPLGINRIKTYQERMIYGHEAVRFVNEKLQAGFNPFTALRSQPTTQLQLGLLSQLQHIKTLLSKHASQSQINTYTEMYNRISQWADLRNLQHVSLYDIGVKEAKDFKEWCLYQKDLAPKTVNNTISHIGMYWDKAVEEQLAMINPFRSITKAKAKDKPVDGSKDIRFEPFTDQEMIDLFAGLRAAKQDAFINFLLFVYYAWARPVELLRLRVKDIELSRSLISFKKNRTKNTNASYVQIVPPLMEIINQMELRKYPPDFYLFSEEYLPGSKALSKNKPSERWRQQVKTKLGIQKDLYALKHTGNIEYLLRNKGNTDLKWQQMQNRHSSTVMTERYIKRLGAFFIEIKDINFRIC